MLRPIVRTLARFAAVASVLAVLPACTKSLMVTYPGGSSPVEYPWRACGQGCVSAFAELQETHDPTGKDCEALVNDAVSMSGGDDRVIAAALYDSALLLVLRGKGDEAWDRLAKAEALDHDPEYRHLEEQLRDSASKATAPGVAPPAPIPPAPIPPAPIPPAPIPQAPLPVAPVAPSAAPAPVASQPAAAPPAVPAPASSALLTPH